MRKKNQMITKYLLAFLLGLGISVSVIAQPYINSISPISAGVGQVINITGNDFTGVTAVYFGGIEGDNMIVVNANLITVEVPFGATFDQVSVVHTSGTGYSPQKFIPTFDGSSISDGSTVLGNLGDQEVFPTSRTQTQDLCLCDVDGDDDIDVIVSNAGDTDGIILYKNNSSLGDADFLTGVVIEDGTTVTNVICGDIDGDGVPDIVGNQLGSEGSLFTYLNDGSGNFDAGEEWSLPVNSNGDFRKPGRIALGDLDLDGKPELVVAVEDENLVYYFENNSTSGNINFNATPVSMAASENSGTAGLGGLDVADLNNDGLPEIIASNFTEFGYYVFQNNSQPNTITFRDPLFVNTNSSIRTLISGDLNNDGFADVVLTNSDISSSNVIEISENNTGSNGGDIDMKAPISLLGIRQSWGVDLGDIDGDGDLDIIVGSEIENGFYTIMNTNPSSIAASSYSVGLVAESNQNNARNIKVADLDNDGRPDFAYTNNSKSTENGNIGTRLNEICFTPVIEPSGSTTLCDGDVVTLVAPSTGYSYSWELNGGATGGATNTLVDINTAGDYTVTILDNAGCQVTSATITVTTPGGAYDPADISASDATPCAGDDITLQVDSEDPSNAYLWEGPNGYTSTTREPVLANVTSENSGNYYLTTTSSGAGNCQATTTALLVNITSTPVVSVNNPKPDFFCTGSNLELSTNDFGGDYEYDWKLDDVSTGGTNPSSYTTSTAGDMTVVITETASGCTYTSAVRVISSVAPPTSSFAPSDTTICETIEVTFDATSTGANGLSIINNWDFKDGTLESGDALTHAFSTAGTYNVSLTAKYDGIADADCTYTLSDSTITVVAAPTDVDLIISDNSDPNSFEKCSDSALTLRLEDDYETYAWRIGTDTISQITIVDVSVEADVFVTLTDSVKCEFSTDPVTVSNYTTGGIIISANTNSVVDDETLGKVINMEEGQSSITLSVNNATEPAWEPALYIDDTTALTVVASVSNKQLITVYGIDNLGCNEKDSVTLVFPGVNAAKSFTPNGDGIGDCWEVSNIGGTDCQVVIFDSKGRRIRELSFNPEGGADDCVWDGNKSNGSALPDGMYYYFISCSDSENESSGSIFMAR